MIREGSHEGVEYARFADDLVVLVDSQLAPAEKEQAYGASGSPQGGLPLPPLAAGGSCDHADQPDSPGVGQLLSPREREPLLLVHPRLGGEEGRRRRLSRNSKRSDFGWKRWSRAWLYDALGLFSAYRVHRGPRLTALPADYVTRQDYSGTKPETADTAGSRPYQLLVRRPRGSRRGALTLLIARSRNRRTLHDAHPRRRRYYA